MKKILVTGASGFIGQFLCETLSKSGRSVLGVVRNLNSILINKNIKYIPVGDIAFKKNWKDLLVDVDLIIHCAGRAPLIKETTFMDFTIDKSLESFKKNSSIILANRITAEIADVEEKLYSRDLFKEN